MPSTTKRKNKKNTLSNTLSFIFKKKKKMRIIENLKKIQEFFFLKYFLYWRNRSKIYERKKGPT